jgi:hypothetical protein
MKLRYAYLCLTFILLLLEARSYGQVPGLLPTENLKGYWNFTGNLSDSSGNEQHAIANSANYTEDRFGNQGASFYFSSSTQHIVIPDSLFAPFISDFSFSMWLRSSYVAKMEMFSSDTLNDGSQLNLRFNDIGGCNFFLTQDSVHNIIAGKYGGYTDGDWHHLIITRQMDSLRIYFDGILSGQLADSSVIESKRGIILSSLKFPWRGNVDDIAVYDRALSQEEIDTLIRPRLRLIAPVGSDDFPVKTTAIIKWVAPRNMNGVDISYSVNEGQTWHEIAKDFSAATEKLAWQVPDLPGYKCIIRLSDADDPALFVLSDTFGISKYEWELVNAHPPFSVRDGVASYVFNNRVYLAGGWNPLDPENYPLVTNDEIWESEDGNHWSLATIAPWAPRHTFGNIVFDKKMWVLGGDQLQCGFQPDVWSSDDGITWNLVNENAPWGNRMLHMYASFNNKMWVMGGEEIVYCDNTTDVTYNDVWNTVDGVSWTKVTDSALWSPRGQISGSVVFDNKLWILGGGVYQKEYYNDIWNTEDGVNWNLVTTNAPWNPRQYHSVIVFDGAMWVMQGRFGTDKNDVWYSKNGIDWRQLKNTPWAPRHAGSTFVYQNSLWLCTGYLYNDVWKMNTVPCPPLEVSVFSAIEGDTATIVANFSNNEARYQWQKYSDSLWVDLIDTLNYSGTQSADLKINMLTSNFQGSVYRCLASAGFCSAVSEEVTLNLCEEIEIQDQVITVGEDAIFRIDLVDSTAVVEWQVFEVDHWLNATETDLLTNITSQSFSILKATSALDRLQVRCHITTSNHCDITTNSATLTVCSEINAIPLAPFAMIGASAAFTISSPHDNYNLQWQTKFDDAWKPLPEGGQYRGTLSDTLEIIDVRLEDEGKEFRCVAAKGKCIVNSNIVLLKICHGSITLPAGQHVAKGENANFTIPDSIAGDSYRWQILNGGTWEDLQNGDKFQGVSSGTLEVLNTDFENNGRQFQCVVEQNNCILTTSPVTLFICPDFSAVLIGPLAVNDEDGGIFFSVLNTSNTAEYQWQINRGAEWTNLTDNDQFKGTSDDTLIVNQINQAIEGNLFRCQLRDMQCTFYSSETRLPIITGSVENSDDPLDKRAFEKGALAEGGVELYPNPVGYSLIVKTLSFENTNIYVSDQLGRVVVKQRLNQVESVIDVTNIPPGLYFIKIDGQKEIVKILKQ